MVQYLFNGFANLISSGSIFALFIGVFLGIIIGALPGLTATMGIALLIPFTYGMNPAFALSLMNSAFCRRNFMVVPISCHFIENAGTPAAGGDCIGWVSSCAKKARRAKLLQ